MHKNNLPPNWAWVKLGDVATSEKGKKPRNLSTEFDKKFCFPYVDIKAFEKRGIDNYTDGDNCRFCESEDVLVVWDGARCGLVGRGVKGVIGSTLAKIKSKQHLDSFLFYFLQWNYKLINLNPKGVGIPHIEPNLFWGLEIPIPPLPVQHQIVGKIEELFSELDKGIENLRKAKEQIKTYRQSVLAYAFSGKLTNSHPELVSGSEKLNQVQLDNSQLPNGWKWVKLGEISKIGTGVTPLRSKKEYYLNGKIPWLTSSVVNESFVYSSTEFVTKRALEEYRLKKYPKHTLLVALYGEGKTRGKCTEMMFESTINQAMAAIVLDEEFFSSLKYVKWFLIKNYEDMRLLSSGGVQPNLNLSLIKNVEIPFSPIMEQQLIVLEIDRRFSVADKLEQTIDESLEKAEQMRQSILKKAFEGKLIQ